MEWFKEHTTEHHVNKNKLMFRYVDDTFVAWYY